MKKPDKNKAKRTEDKRFMSHKKRLRFAKIAVFIAALLFLIAPMSTNIPEANMFSTVTALGIDKSEDGLIASAEVVLPVESNGATGVSIVLSGKGTTLSSALENLCISIGRTLDLSHCAIIVIGNDFAKEGIMDEMQFLLSSGKVSPQIGMVLSGNKDAKEFITRLNSYGEKLDVENLLKYTNYGSHNYSQSLISFLRQTHSKSHAAVMPCIMMGDTPDNLSAVEGKNLPKEKENPQNNSQNNNEKDTSAKNDSSLNKDTKEEEGKDNPTVIQRTERVAAFKDGRLKSIWGAAEGNGLAWSDTKTKFGHITLYELEYNGKTIDKLSCYLIKKKVKMHSSFKGEKPTVTFKIEADFIIEERFKLHQAIDSLNSAQTKKIYPVIIKGLEDKISEYILTANATSKQKDVDVFLINDLFFKHHKQKYKKYIKSNDLLQNAEIKFSFDIKIN